MITQDAFPVEPWQVRETRLDLDLLAQSESAFALSNGHIGFRGNLDEGEPHGLPGVDYYERRTVRDSTLAIRHAGADLTLSTREPTVVDVKPRQSLLPPPPQPPGRAPTHRRLHTA